MDLNKLPIELWSQILSNIGLNELFGLRAVSRLFKQCCEETKKEDLNVYVGKTRRELKEDDLSLAKFLFFKKTFTFSHHLKKLDLTLLYPELAGEFDFGVLNEFNQLSFLRIQGYLPKDDLKTLSLPKLLTLYIVEYRDGVYRFKVDAPKLKFLSFGDLKSIELVCPESIRTIQCEECDYSTLLKFKSLEIMQCSVYLELKDDILSELVHLKELHFDFPYLPSYFTEEEFEVLKVTLKEVLKQRELLKRSDFLITWRNVRLVNAEQLDVSYRLVRNLFNFPAKNYRFLLEKFRFSYHFMPDRLYMNYGHLMDGLDGGELRDDFFEKFNVSWVEVTDEVKDPEHFLSFLKSVPTLKGLNLNSSALSQSFMERLADELPDVHADIKEFSVFDTRTELDLRFIFKFSNLEIFHTNLDTTTNEHDLLYEAGERLVKLKLFTVGNLTTRFISDLKELGR